MHIFSFNSSSNTPSNLRLYLLYCSHQTPVKWVCLRLHQYNNHKPHTVRQWLFDLCLFLIYWTNGNYKYNTSYFIISNCKVNRGSQTVFLHSIINSIHLWYKTVTSEESIMITYFHHGNVRASNGSNHASNVRLINFSKDLKHPSMKPFCLIRELFTRGQRGRAFCPCLRVTEVELPLPEATDQVPHNWNTNTHIHNYLNKYCPMQHTYMENKNYICCKVFNLCIKQLVFYTWIKLSQPIKIYEKSGRKTNRKPSLYSSTTSFKFLLSHPLLYKYNRFVKFLCAKHPTAVAD